MNWYLVINVVTVIGVAFTVIGATFTGISVYLKWKNRNSKKGDSYKSEPKKDVYYWFPPTRRTRL